VSPIFKSPPRGIRGLIEAIPAVSINTDKIKIEPSAYRGGKMKRIIPMSILSVLLLVTLGLTACGGSEPTTGQPVIHFDQETVDVGNVSPGVALDYSFRFTNEGDAPLIVDDDVAIKTLEGC